MCLFRRFNNGDSLTHQTPIGKDWLTDINKQHFSPLKKSLENFAQAYVQLLLSLSVFQVLLKGITGYQVLFGAFVVKDSLLSNQNQSSTSPLLSPYSHQLKWADFTRPNGHHCLNRIEITILLA